MKRKCKPCARIRRVLPAPLRRKLEQVEERMIEKATQEKAGESRKA